MVPLARANSARRWSSAASTRTSSRAGDHARAQAAQSRSGRSNSSPRSTGLRRRISIFDPLVFPVRAPATSNTSGSAVETIEGVRLIKQALPAVQDRARHLQRIVRPAGRRPRSAELGVALPLRAGRPGPRDRQFGEAGALSLDSGRGAEARRGPDLVTAARIRSRRLRRYFRDRKKPKRTREERKSCRSTSGSRVVHHRGIARRLDRGPGRGDADGAAHGDHQRPADEGDGRGRAAVQCQPADRGRGAADPPRR